MTREQFVLAIKGELEALRRFLLALCCGNRAMADDILQDTCVKAYLALDSYKETGSFSAWLFRIAYNSFLNVRQASARHQFVDVEEASDRVSTNFEPDDAFRYQELYDALSLLSAKERSAILLYYLQGYSVKEIASIQNTNVLAVRQLLSRGRRHLKQVLL